MQEHEIELMIGDAVCIGDCVFTVVDIDDSEVSFRVDRIDGAEPDAALTEGLMHLPRPRK